MSEEKSKVTDKASEIAKNIWLAGVGAYGKAVEDAQDRLGKAMEPPKLFKDLVKAGAALEEDAREALETTANARASVEDRISKVRENFHMQRPARIEDLVALDKKVDALTKKVKTLSVALEALTTPSPTRPKKAATKTKAKPKAPKKKVAASKAAPKKKTAKPKSKAASPKKPVARKR